MRTSLLLLFLGYLLSLLLFQSAFLIRRRELGLRSSCADAQVGSRCWLRPQVNRVILFVIDALRYDFVAPQPNSTASFHNQMSGVAKLLSHSLLIPFIANPPTTTLQRLKALTTGTFPTFIDAGDNFSNDVRIVEDNVVDQLVAANKNVTFLGDDTCFDVKDLHTVDRGVQEHLWRELEKNDWNLLIAHFLGVDHCGHKYGPNHPEMSTKLREMDRVIVEAAGRLRDGDVLMVIGDHGMTSDGDHGGDSDDEVTAALLAVQPRGFPRRTAPASQIDLVPTLSLLLGVPIPYSSLGVVIEEFFPEEVLNSVWEMNVEQMRRFVKTYSESSDGDVSPLLQSATTRDERRRAALKIQEAMQNRWTHFDVPLMQLALAALLETFLYNCHCEDKSSKTVNLIMRSGMLLLEVSLLLSGSENYLAMSMLFMTLSVTMVWHALTLLPYLLDVFSADFSWRFLFVRSLPVLHALSFLSNSYVVSEAQVVRFFLQTLLVLGFSDVLRSLPGTRTRSRSFNWKGVWQETLLCFTGLAALRAEFLFHRCREEEAPFCEQYPFAMSFLSLPLDTRQLRFLVGIFSAVLLNWRLSRELKQKDRSGVARAVRASSWLYICVVVLQWGCDWLPESPSARSFSLYAAFALYVWVVASSVLYALSSTSAPVLILDLLRSLSLLALLLLRDGLAPALLLFLFIFYTFQQLIKSERELATALSLLVSYGFYAFGHQPSLTLIPWTAAFVGVPGNFSIRAVPALLVLLHLFCSSLLSSVLSLALPFPHLLSFVSLCSLRALLVSVAALIHRRHLMVWKIFAPKFIFESVSLLVLLASLCLLVALSSKALKAVAR